MLSELLLANSTHTKVPKHSKRLRGRDRDIH